MSQKQNTHYVVINGRKVSPQKTVRSIDGVRPVAVRPYTTQPQQAKQSVQQAAGAPQPRPKQQRQHKARAAHTMHAKQNPAPRRSKNSAATTVPVKMPIDNIDYTKHKLPRAAHTTEARTQRAKYHNQHNQVSRYGSTHYEPLFSQLRVEQPTAESSEVHDISPIPAVTLPTNPSAVNQRIIDTNLRTPVQEQQVETAASRKTFRAWLNSQRTKSMAASLVSLLLIIGYVAYVNVPNLALRVAASRSGVNAQMPKYSPSGFALNGPVEYSEGEVALNYASNTDRRSFELVQQESTWDSQSLLNNYVLEQTSQYQTVEQDGLTIYIFNGSDAAWVNRGILYTIDGESLLNQEQIVNIATSL